MPQVFIQIHRPPWVAKETLSVPLLSVSFAYYVGLCIQYVGLLTSQQGAGALKTKHQLIGLDMLRHDIRR